MLLVPARLEPEALVAEGGKYMASKDSKWANQRFEAARTLESDYPGGRHTLHYKALTSTEPGGLMGRVW